MGDNRSPRPAESSLAMTQESLHSVVPRANHASVGTGSGRQSDKPKRVRFVVEPSQAVTTKRQTRPLSLKARWAIVWALAAGHPLLLYALYPIVGDAINTIVLAGPVAATLLLSVRAGALLILLNTTVSGVVFWHLAGTPFEEGLPKAIISVLVTIAVCLGAARLRQFVEQRKAMEAAFQQSQKLEAIGRLAAGVAHDINNTLNAIMGSTFALRHEFADNGHQLQDLDRIAQACERGAQLTRNLLGFASKSCSRNEPVSLNTVAQEVKWLLSRTARSSIVIELQLAEPPALMLGDAAQLGHAVMNLCLNALDAMAEHGTLTIATTHEAGKASISVSDTGTGMSAQVREHAFEPFFTTKPLGEGTGMGLAMVYGTVCAMRGTIALATQLGAGTSITLTFPEASPIPPRSCEPVVDTTPAQRLAGLTVLLVDDDHLVLRAGTRMMQAMGCTVLSANGGREGFELFRLHRETIALTVLDLAMPERDGLATMSDILSLAPQTPIVLASGYAGDASKLESTLARHPNVVFLAKPYNQKALSIAAARVLPVGPRLTTRPEGSGAA